MANDIAIRVEKVIIIKKSNERSFVDVIKT